MTVYELRIGNLVSHKGKILNVQSVNWWTKQINFGVLYDDGIPVDELEPIAITEEWLEEFGFTIEHTIGGFLRWQKGDFKLLDGRLPNPQYHTPNAALKSIHQLQNLYFALTGEELKTPEIPEYEYE